MLSVAMKTSWMNKHGQDARSHQCQHLTHTRVVQVDGRRPMEFIHHQPGQLDQQEQERTDQAAIHQTEYSHPKSWQCSADRCW